MRVSWNSPRCVLMVKYIRWSGSTRKCINALDRSILENIVASPILSKMHWNDRMSPIGVVDLLCQAFLLHLSQFSVYLFVKGVSHHTRSVVNGFRRTFELNSECVRTAAVAGWIGRRPLNHE